MASPPLPPVRPADAVDVERGERGHQRGTVLPDVVATVIDEVSIAETESIGGGPGGLAAPERVLEDGRVRRSRRERHDMDPVAPQVQEPTGGLRDRLGADEDRRGVAQQPGTQPLAEARRGPALEGLGQLPRREIQERHHRRQARRDRHGVARRVIHGARRPASGPPATPRRPRHRAGRTGRRSAPPGGAAGSAAAGAGRRPRGVRSASSGHPRPRRAGTRTTRPGAGPRRSRSAGRRDTPRSVARGPAPAATGRP